MTEPAAAEVPVVVFKHVSLAFDDTVVLRDVSFTLGKGHTKIILGASGAGKSISLKLILGLLKPDGGEVWVNGQRVDVFTEEEMMKVAQTQMDHQTATSLYARGLAMLKTAIGKN